MATYVKIPSVLCCLSENRRLRRRAPATYAHDGILLVVVGFLVLDGWKLNITESVTLAIAVGMSVDFTVHFGVSYLHSRRLTPPRLATMSSAHLNAAPVPRSAGNFPRTSPGLVLAADWWCYHGRVAKWSVA